MAQLKRRIRSWEHHRWVARDGAYAVLAVLMLIFVAAASLSDGKLLPDLSRMKLPPGPQASDETHDDGLRTGSIFITPPDGNICEHRLIDNETWLIRPNGTIECDAAVTLRMHPDGAFTWQSRIEAIRDGFVSKR
jgi:hypothetical protein